MIGQALARVVRRLRGQQEPQEPEPVEWAAQRRLEARIRAEDELDLAAYARIRDDVEGPQAQWTLPPIDENGGYVMEADPYGNT